MKRSTLICGIMFVLLFCTAAMGLAECYGDFDCDGDVDASDLSLFSSSFGATSCANCFGYCGQFEAEILTGQNCEQDYHQCQSLGVVTIHLASTGGAFLILHGVYFPTPTPTDPDYKPILFSGTGQVVNGFFFMNMHSTQEHANCWRDARLSQATIELSKVGSPGIHGTIWNTGVDKCIGEEGEHTAYDSHYIRSKGPLPQCVIGN